MYIPDAFAESRLPVLHEAINACGLAIFVTAEGGVPCATHAPMLLAPEQGQYGTLHFHLARANQQWRTAAPGATALVIFPGPDGYVSPSWYKSKAEHGRVGEILAAERCDEIDDGVEGDQANRDVLQPDVA